jgi:hypothetical protein
VKPRVVAAEQIGRRPVPERPSVVLKAMTVVLGLAAASGLAGAFLLGRPGDVDAWTVAALVVLSVVATQRVAIFGDETAINSSMVILSAAAATAVAGGPLWVPAVCGLAAGLHWDHVRNGAFRKLVVNASCTTLATLAAAALGRSLFVAGASEWIAVGLSAILAVVGYWTVNNVLVAAILWAADGGSLGRHIRELTRSETELLPFAILGFVAGYVVLRDVGTWAMVLALVGLLLVADPVVVRRLAPKSVWRVSGIVALTAGVLLAVGISADTASAEKFPASAEFLALVGLGGLGALALVRIRPAAARAALVVAGSAAFIVFHRGEPALGPLVVLIATGLPLLSPPVSNSARRRLAYSIVLGATVLVSATVFLPSAFVSSAGGAVVAGAVAGCAALIGWHLSVLIESLREHGVEGYVAVGLIRSDVPLFVGGGLAGGLVGWIGLHVGVASMGGALTAIMLMAVVISLRRRALVSPSALELSDDELLDVVRSALLGLPASRLPGD